ncbi:MAG: class I SAM-dependent methyltransferase [Halobacteriovoraceae bacterium]|nr:class I SAM-dependent methyltransferase [Halobacteriovoraceae bacterium]
MIKSAFSSYFAENKMKDELFKDGIPRFIPFSSSYSEGNFSKLREKHATLQLDSVNGTSQRIKTFFRKTTWPKNFLEGKTVLECGCGAGPDTEVLASLGAKVVAVDQAGVDIAARNLKNHPNVQFVQASITDLPCKPKSFDIVFCHRVLQHTPNPEKTLDYILQFVKDDGAVFVDSYARNFFQMFRWKYLFLPITNKMDPEKLYNIIKWYAPFLFVVTRFFNKLGIFGKYFNWVFIPFMNYRHVPVFSDKSDEFIIEYGVHDTFDALAPKYDIPLSAKKMDQIAKKHLKKPYEIHTEKSMTILRTKVTH